MSEEVLKNDVVETEYDASQIQVLEGLEAVRKRPGMYIGSTSASGLHHLVYEIVDNAIDEALAGYCHHVEVTINEGDTITVQDDGRGIPVDIQAQTGRPALEVVYTVLHAGGKFGGGGYKVSGGLHGVGASVVNALSEWLEVEVAKEGHIYQMKFARGHITQEMRIIGTTDEHGTKVTFKPDPEMFDTLEYDYETLHTRMREQAFLNAGLHITITDARIGSQDKPEKERFDSMCYEGGIREFVRWYNRHKTPLHEQVVYMAGKKGDQTAEVALQYNDSFTETIVSFANDIHTPEGGMHEEGFKRALTNVLNAYGIKKGYLKNDDKLSGDDVREGLTAIVSVKLTDAQFEGQTKAKLGNASMRTLVNAVVSEQLAVFLEENPTVGKAILDKAMTVDAVYMFPGSGRDYPIQPGKEVVVAINAINHKEFNSKSIDLSSANFEIYDESSNPNFSDTDNPNVPNLINWYDYSASYFSMHNRGFKAYAMCRPTVDAQTFIKNYKYTYTYLFTFGEYAFDMDGEAFKIPNDWIIDAVNLSVASEYKWNVTSSALDAGWAHCGSVDPVIAVNLRQRPVALWQSRRA